MLNTLQVVNPPENSWLHRATRFCYLFGRMPQSIASAFRPVFAALFDLFAGVSVAGSEPAFYGARCTSCLEQGVPGGTPGWGRGCKCRGPIALKRGGAFSLSFWGGASVKEELGRREVIEPRRAWRPRWHISLKRVMRVRVPPSFSTGALAGCASPRNQWNSPGTHRNNHLFVAVSALSRRTPGLFAKLLSWNPTKELAEI